MQFSLAFFLSTVVLDPVLQFHQLTLETQQLFKIEMPIQGFSYIRLANLRS
jgi:hypothetical protein